MEIRLKRSVGITHLSKAEQTVCPVLGIKNGIVYASTSISAYGRNLIIKSGV